MSDHTDETAYNTLLNITNHNISQHLSPNKINSTHKTPLKSALKHTTTQSQHTADSENHTDTAVELDTKSTKILNILDQSYNDIKQLLLQTQLQYNALQQQYTTLQHENHTLKQHNTDIQSQLNTVQQHTDKQLQQAKDNAVQNKHTQNLHVMHRLRTANNALNVSTLFNAWKSMYYKHRLQKQKQRFTKQLHQQTDTLKQQHTQETEQLNNTITEQQHTINQYKLSQIALNDKLKQALLRSVCAVNTEALNILNDPIYSNLNDIIEPNSIDLLPKPHIKQYNTVNTVPVTVKKSSSQKRENYKHNVMKQMHVHNTHVFR